MARRRFEPKDYDAIFAELDGKMIVLPLRRRLDQVETLPERHPYVDGGVNRH